MRLDKLLLINFKNIQQVELSLSEGFNCFVGENGAGKTTLFKMLIPSRLGIIRSKTSNSGWICVIFFNACSPSQAVPTT